MIVVGNEQELQEAIEREEQSIVIENQNLAGKKLIRYRLVKWGIPSITAVVFSAMTAPFAISGGTTEMVTAILAPLVGFFGAWVGLSFFRTYEVIVIDADGKRQVRMENTSWS